MELILIILLVLLFIIFIILIVRNHLKKSEQQKYYAAAGNILREEFLNYSLQNTISPDGKVSEPRSAKMMVYLKSKSSGKKTQFVFDPEREIKFGRDSVNSNIFINDSAVSQYHCRIYTYDYTVYLQDMNSSNGTFVKRGAFKSYSIYNGNQIALRTGDKIIVGSCMFEVCLFYYDLNTM